MKADDDEEANARPQTPASGKKRKTATGTPKSKGKGKGRGKGVFSLEMVGGRAFANQSQLPRTKQTVMTRRIPLMLELTWMILIAVLLRESRLRILVRMKLRSRVFSWIIFEWERLR